MTQTKQLSAALLALLIAMPLISHGASSGTSIWMWLGGGLLIVGAAVPIYARMFRGDSCSEASMRRLWHRLMYHTLMPHKHDSTES